MFLPNIQPIARLAGCSYCTFPVAMRYPIMAQTCKNTPLSHSTFFIDGSRRREYHVCEHSHRRCDNERTVNIPHVARPLVVGKSREIYCAGCIESVFVVSLFFLSQKSRQPPIQFGIFGVVDKFTPSVFEHALSLTLGPATVFAANRFKYAHARATHSRTLSPIRVIPRDS